MIAIQLSVSEWKNIICTTISANLNSAGMVKIMAHPMLYGPEIYEGYNLQTSLFLQTICNMVLHQESISSSQTRQPF